MTSTENIGLEVIRSVMFDINTITSEVHTRSLKYEEVSAVKVAFYDDCFIKKVILRILNSVSDQEFKDVITYLEETPNQQRVLKMKFDFVSEEGTNHDCSWKTFTNIFMKDGFPNMVHHKLQTLDHIYVVI